MCEAHDNRAFVDFARDHALVKGKLPTFEQVSLEPPLRISLPIKADCKLLIE